MKKLLTIISAAFLIIFTSCMPQGSAGEANAIIVAGSTTVTPVMRALGAAYEEISGSAVNIQELGTSAGINATIEGIAHVAMASRSITEAEIERGLVPTRFAMDGVVVVVHPSNTIDNLSVDQVRDIFEGTITNWSEVGGNDATITVMSREEGSGARSSFESLAGIDEVAIPALIQQGTGVVISGVSSNRNAIGYVTTGVLTDALKALSIDGVAFSEAAVIDGTYKFSNAFFVALPQNPTAQARSFVDFLISPAGQSIISQAGYVSVY